MFPRYTFGFLISVYKISLAMIDLPSLAADSSTSLYPPLLSLLILRLGADDFLTCEYIGKLPMRSVILGRSIFPIADHPEEAED